MGLMSTIVPRRTVSGTRQLRDRVAVQLSTVHTYCKHSNQHDGGHPVRSMSTLVNRFAVWYRRSMVAVLVLPVWLAGPLSDAVGTKDVSDTVATYEDGVVARKTSGHTTFTDNVF
jgi:hypothetical protein